MKIECEDKECKHRRLLVAITGAKEWEISCLRQERLGMINNFKLQNYYSSLPKEFFLPPFMKG